MPNFVLFMSETVESSENESLGDALSDLLRQLHFGARVFFRDGYCGGWAVDTSGSAQVPFHLVCQGEGWLHDVQNDAPNDAPNDAKDTQPSTPNGAAPKKLLAGQLVFFPQDTPHILSAAPEPPDPTVINQPPPPRLQGDITRLVCGYYEFDQRTAAPLLNSLPSTIILDLARTEDASTRELVNLLMREAGQKDLGSHLAVDRLAELVFIQMLRHEIRSGRLQGIIGALGDPHLGQVLAAIHQQPGADHNMVDLAHRSGLSESAFAQKFKKSTGMTAGQYVRHWRMQTAARALAETSRSILDIANAVGYESEVAFRKAFSLHFECPPGSYRRSQTR